MCGRYYCDFLRAIDSIHMHQKYRFPKMVNPFFYVTHEEADGVVFHYRTIRFGFSSLLIGNDARSCNGVKVYHMTHRFFPGILDQVATDFYSVQLQVEELTSSTPEASNAIAAEEGYHFKFRLKFDNQSYMANRAAKKGLVIDPGRLSFSDRRSDRTEDRLPPLSSTILLRLFPFTFMFREDLTVFDCGVMMQQIFPGEVFVGRNLKDVARMRMPKLSLTWENVSVDLKDRSLYVLAYI